MKSGFNQRWDEMTYQEQLRYEKWIRKHLKGVKSRHERNRKIRQAIDAIEQEALCKRP